MGHARRLCLCWPTSGRLGLGMPFFVRPQPRLRLVATDRIGEDVIRLKYVPAKSEC
jgi:hypothetical protein